MTNRNKKLVIIFKKKFFLQYFLVLLLLKTIFSYFIKINKFLIVFTRYIKNKNVYFLSLSFISLFMFFNV